MNIDTLADTVKQVLAERDHMLAERGQLIDLLGHLYVVLCSSDADHPDCLKDPVDTVQLLWDKEDEIRAAVAKHFYLVEKFDREGLTQWLRDAGAEGNLNPYSYRAAMGDARVAELGYLHLVLGERKQHV